MNEDHNKENFSFIREQIKEKPFSKKRMLKEVCFVAILAVIFGVIAGLVFVAVKGAFTEEEPVEETEQFTIPNDELPVEDVQIQEVPTEIIEQQDVVTTDEVQDMIDELGPDEYQSLITKIIDIGKEANKSIVTVSGITSDTDFLDMAYETEGVTSGLILGDNGVQKLILTQYSVVCDAQEIQVAFIDESEHDASILGYDTSTNLAIIGVDLEDITEETNEEIADATLGNSYRVEQGQVVLALGNPAGEVYSILSGTITSTTGELKLDDGNYSVFSTDMVGDQSGSGVLINLSGEVVGLYSATLSIPNEENIITAVSVSDAKSLMEHLSNAKNMAYLGVQMTTITEDLAEENDIPEGAYLTTVEMGSPAFDAGLRVGDVITKIGTEDVEEEDDVNHYLIDCESGDSVTIKVERLGNGEYKEVSCTAVLQ